MAASYHIRFLFAISWYEAVAQGIAAIRGNEWVAGLAQGLNVVKVSVADIRVEHEVRLMEFTKWLERDVLGRRARPVTASGSFDTRDADVTSETGCQIKQSECPRKRGASGAAADTNRKL